MKTIACIAVAGLAGSALAQSEYIDFDELPSGTVITTQYTAQGVTFQTDASDTEANDLLGNTGLEISAPNVLRSVSDGTISFSFSTPVESLSFWGVSVEDSSSASYYRNGNLLFSDSRPGTGDFFIPEFYDYANGGGIDHVVFTAFDGGAGDAFGIDDLRFTVPAPGSVALMGFGGLALARRRR